MSGEETAQHVAEVLEQSADVCCAANCGKLGEFHVGGRIWAVGDDLCKRPPIEFTTALVACAAHKEKMPSTLEVFLAMPFRESLTAQCRALGKQPPNYKTAQWVFHPIKQPAKAEAN